ncbi:MAG: protein-L-isoaspartate(D-aspartate) O-methyltransferase [Gammaproteobacteria bacterium]|nr:protein-L-isoaspartate(D-aspartate) O-methyltransferase [Gammaproteobacteria bacterium]
MLAEIQLMMKMTEASVGKASLSGRVADAMMAVPRHKFVPSNIQSAAYENSALPISHKQTISQPYIVALMTDLAAVTSESVVLEVGTGSGYQAAVLSELVSHVYSIEIIEPLGLEAKSLLQDLGYDNVTVKIGDGYHGWPEHAPFDAILVTAAAEHIPEQLIQQLKPGGRLVIPVGKQGQPQSLRILTKGADGKIEQRDVLSVAFVPLTGKH